PHEAPAAEKVIPMTCAFCQHQWTEPYSKAGKNVICPNAECRQRMKVPEPKEDVPEDWRQHKTKLPSLAKEKHEKLEDVQDAGEAKIVSGKALQEADATGVEIEPRSLKDKLFNVFLVVTVLGLIVGGIWYWRSSAGVEGENRLMADAQKEFDKIAGELPPDEKVLSSAVLHAAAAEYALMRTGNGKDLKPAYDLRLKAGGEVAQQQGPERNAIAGELALAVLAFGGTDEQAKEQLRFRWLPDTSGGPTKLNERNHNVHEQLRQTLALL